MAILRKSESKIQDRLNILAQVRQRQAALSGLYQQLIADNPELQEVQQLLDAEAAEAAALEQEIKTAVLKHGKTIKGAQLQAVWNKGRTSWDTKGLIGFAVAHPEMEKFKQTGDPTVSIRKA